MSLKVVHLASGGSVRDLLAGVPVDSLPDLVEALDTLVTDGVMTLEQAAALGQRVYALSKNLLTDWNTVVARAVAASMLTSIGDGMTTEQWLAGPWLGIVDTYSSTESAAYSARVVTAAAVTGRAIGDYAQQFSIAGMRAEPYWMYVTMRDDRVRPTHASLDGKVFSKMDAMARRYLPPWEWNCRCVARSLAQEDLDNMGLPVSSGSSIPFTRTAKGKAIGFPQEPWNTDRVRQLVPEMFRFSEGRP